MQMFIITVRRENVYIVAFPDGVIDDVNYDGEHPGVSVSFK
ncbi:MAG: hypothetical protein ACLVJ3_16650 [Coprococcus phoceensis]